MFLEYKKKRKKEVEVSVKSFTHKIMSDLIRVGKA